MNPLDKNAFEQLLGRTPDESVGAPLQHLIGADCAQQVKLAAQYDNQLEAPELCFSLNGGVFEGFVHRHQGVLVLELEVQSKPAKVADQATNLGRMLQLLQKAQSLQALYEISVQEIQAITGYDRVLIYRFEEEGHGQVIAEATSPSMEVFQGLFFPASDIPEQTAQSGRL